MRYFRTRNSSERNQFLKKRSVRRLQQSGNRKALRRVLGHKSIPLPPEFSTGEKTMLEQVVYDNGNTNFAKRVEFARTIKAQICHKSEYALNIVPITFLGEAAKAAGADLAQVRSDDSDEFFLELEHGLVQIHMGGVGGPFTEARHNFTVHVTGHLQFVESFFTALDAKYTDARLATIKWWYRTHNYNDSSTVPLSPPLQPLDEFYPFIPEGVDSYLRRYMDSSASILFLSGAPGTGKTSLLRHMVYKFRMKAVLTYDEAIVNSDEMFVDFLCDDEDSVLIVEDADLLVISRVSEPNKGMSRFLNASDGLIKTSGKKIVFTANQKDFSKVDPALIRPGRCFDSLVFRALSYEEAVVAATAAKVPLPTKVREYTLGEIFSTAPTAQVRKLGY